MFKIGLTGGICSGKTYILKVFEELKCYTLRADDIAKEIIFSDNEEIRAKIGAVFGEQIFLPDNSINKDAFTKLLFSDNKKRDFINNVIHPLVIKERQKILNDLEETEIYKFLIYESALLVESNSYTEFDKVIVVYANPEEQLQRLMERDKISEEEAMIKIKAQFPLSEKLKIADYTIDTSGSFESTKRNTLETFYLLEKDLLT